MTKISASEVNMLRKKTGAGLMDCKKALTEAEGDFEKATDILRKKGQKIAAKRGERDAKEGYVIAKTNEELKRGAILILNCETDFVAKNEEFTNYANAIIDLALSKGIKSIDSILEESINDESVKDGITNLVGKIGEKIELSQLHTIDSDQVIAYNHPGNRLASLVGLNVNKGDDGETVGKDVAMQIAAMNPVALDRDGVDKSIIEREMEIGMEQARQEGKPEAILEKIATGKLNKFYKENTLLNQEFIKDNKKTIKQLLSEIDSSLTITEFCRQSLS